MSPASSQFGRVKQWGTFARVWHIYDCKWQNPFRSAEKIQQYLVGRNKPIFHPSSDCGDHVVAINTKHIAMHCIEWEKRVYFHHTGFPGGASWTTAVELHFLNPMLIMQKAVYREIGKVIHRRTLMMRLHLYPDEDIPPEIMQNVTSQIRQLRPVPRKLEDYSEEEIQKYPKVFDYPDSYVLK